MTTVYDYTVRKTNDQLQSLQDYAGNVLLIVNTASKCGFTPQFEELQALYEEFKDQGLMILGFPCGQFNNQEFEDIDETTSFCQVNYGVTFPMFAKIDVNGPNTDPLYQYLKKAKRGILLDTIKWNFTKFLVDRSGRPVKRYAPTTKPSEIRKDIVRLLSDSASTPPDS